MVCCKRELVLAWEVKFGVVMVSCQGKVILLSCAIASILFGLSSLALEKILMVEPIIHIIV